MEVVQRLVAQRPGRDSALFNAGVPFAARYGIERITGERLHRYRLTPGQFERLDADLRGMSPARLAEGAGPALFVLWAAEWFRRRYRGGGHEWRLLCEALATQLDQNMLRQIAATGLKRWQRPLIAGEGGRYFLGTLAREGGFPAAAVELGGGNWARDMLRNMVAALMSASAPCTDVALSAGRPLCSRLPATFRDDDFLLLCADLAVEVARVRQESEGAAAAAQVPLGAWLALHRPNWRDGLPIAIDQSGAAALVVWGERAG
jgi:hypothetical protein